MLYFFVGCYSIFTLCIFFEYRYSLRKNLGLYVRNDMIQTFMTFGIFSVLYQTIFLLILLPLLSPLFNFWKINWMDNRVLYWVLLTLIYDFIYYWLHRLEHELTWAWKLSHVHHHSTRHLNLLNGFRSSFLQPLYLPLFVWPLVMLGFQNQDIVLMIVLNKFYNFWLHQIHSKKYGAFELLVNTPSQHRVHHGRNSQYINRNYGGIFIFWDRIFKTYALEEEKVSFGIMQDPEKMNLKEYLAIGLSK